MIFNLMKPVPVQTATMYSYNGTVLPALPTWDMEKYPYAWIQGGETPRLVVSEFGLRYTPGDIWPGVFPYDYENEIGCNVAKCEISSLVNEAWGAFTPYDFAAFGGSTEFDPIIWTNHNIISDYGNDSVYLSASEPVPVYE